MLTLLALLLTLLGSCVGRLPHMQAPPRPEQPPIENVAIFSPQQAAAASFNEIPDIEAFWQVTPEDIARLEADLAAHIRMTPELQPLADRYRAYQRQYIGYERDGERFIYGNFFCDNFDQNWREQLVIVMDGGDCFFSFSYRPADGTFPSFVVNGEA